MLLLGGDRTDRTGKKGMVFTFLWCKYSRQKKEDRNSSESSTKRVAFS